MSQIIEFQLVKKDGTVEPLADGNCSANVYMAVFDFLETEYDIDCYGNPAEGESGPEQEGYLFEGVFTPVQAAEILQALAEEELAQTASGLATDWNLETKRVLQGLKTLQDNLTKVDANNYLRYVIC